MYILYDEFDLNSFFENEPISMGDVESGELLCEIRNNDFEMICVIDTYRCEVELSITYHKNVVFNSKYESIKEIVLSEDGTTLYIYYSKERRIVLKKGLQFGILVE